MEIDIFSVFLFSSIWLDWHFWSTVLLVTVALGLIIFVHELGHFLAAKACGVRCDKFYIGFDFFGWKFCKFKWGETEYGIGVFPLGGYVKMLGQEDNPGELRERLEKAKAARLELEKNAENAAASEPVLSEAEIAEMERMIKDPRSYQAKNVPQRLVIIVAGVAMNVVFAFIAAVLAYGLGTYRNSSEIALVVPGQAAWEVGLQPGDTITEINRNPIQYYQDIPKNVTLGDKLEKGIPLVYRRPGVEAAQGTIVFPRKYALGPMLGVGAGANELKLYKDAPVEMLSPADAAAVKLKGGDRVVEVDGEKVADYLDYLKAVYQGMGKPLAIKFGRPAEEKKADKDVMPPPLLAEKDAPAEYFDVVLAPKKLRHLGVVFEMGPVQMVQHGSPAEKAGIKAGDTLVKIEENGEMVPIGDPLTLPYRVFQMAKTQDEVTFLVRRGEKEWRVVPADVSIASENPSGAKEEIVTVKLNRDVVPATLPGWGSGLAVSEIGLAFIPSTKIAGMMPEAVKGETPKKATFWSWLMSVIFGGATEVETLERGDVVTGMRLVYKPADDKKAGMSEDDKKRQEEIAEKFKKPVDEIFRKGISSLPMAWYDIQRFPLEGTRVEIVAERPSADGKSVTKVKVKVPPAEYADVYTPTTGLNMDMKPPIMLRAENFGQAITLGAEETWNSLTLVYRTLGKLFSGQVSAKALGGPILIATAAYDSAKHSWSSLLMFVCLISANLAVMNLLPIPVLDGGHVVFLLYEGVTGRPPNENLVIALSYMGLLLFLALTFFVFALDLGFISRI